MTFTDDLTTTVRVRFGETDQMGIAHHSAYVLWCEVARVEWLRVRGFSYRQLEHSGVSLAVSKLELSYRQACYFDDELALHARLVEARSRRFTFSYKLTRLSDGALIALAQTYHTPTNPQGKAIRAPQAWLQPLQAHIIDTPYTAA